ncbi:MAG TPA: hypothetical protein VIL74_21080 [Pyrinomonadaceae bacterium]|jgi:hypothetical protein
MQSPARKIIIAVLFSAVFAACTADDANTANQNSANQTTTATNSNSVHDNVDELELTIKLPYHPEEAVWREEPVGKAPTGRVPGPTDRKLIAVLRFPKEDADKITAQAEKYKPAAPETIQTESWFPAELIAQSQTSGDETVKGASFPANDFYNPPYSDGKITRVEGTDYFVLELFTK